MNNLMSVHYQMSKEIEQITNDELSGDPRSEFITTMLVNLYENAFVGFANEISMLNFISELFKENGWQIFYVIENQTVYIYSNNELFSEDDWYTQFCLYREDNQLYMGCDV